MKMVPINYIKIGWQGHPIKDLSLIIQKDCFSGSPFGLLLEALC